MHGDALNHRSLVPHDSSSCSVCYSDAHRPVTLCEKHVVCHRCAKRWFGTHRRDTCPMCRRTFDVFGIEEFYRLEGEREKLLSLGAGYEVTWHPCIVRSDDNVSFINQLKR